MRLAVLVAVAVLVAWTSTLDGQSPASQIVSPVPPSAKSIAAGRQLYERYCRGCHGENATGNGPLAPRDVHPPNLADDVWAHGATDGEIFANIRDGIPPDYDMKPMKSRMTANEIWHVVNYLRSLSRTQ